MCKRLLLYVRCCKNTKPFPCSQHTQDWCDFTDYTRVVRASALVHPSPQDCVFVSVATSKAKGDGLFLCHKSVLYMSQQRDKHTGSKCRIIPLQRCYGVEGVIFLLLWHYAVKINLAVIQNYSICKDFITQTNQKTTDTNQPRFSLLLYIWKFCISFIVKLEIK